MRSYRLLVWACAVAGLSLACDSPADPGPLQRPMGGSGLGGTTVKLSLPVPLSPVGGEIAASLSPVLRARNSRGLFTPDVDPLLVFEVFDEANTLVYRSLPVPQDPSNATAHVVASPLTAARSYSWRAIPLVDGREGPPSARATFRTP